MGKSQDYVTDSLMRVSAGVEDAGDLKEDLEQAQEKVCMTAICYFFITGK